MNIHWNFFWLPRSAGFYLLCLEFLRSNLGVAGSFDVFFCFCFAFLNFLRSFLLCFQWSFLLLSSESFLLLFVSLVILRSSCVIRFSFFIFLSTSWSLFVFIRNCLSPWNLLYLPYSYLVFLDFMGPPRSLYNISKPCLPPSHSVF